MMANNTVIDINISTKMCTVATILAISPLIFKIYVLNVVFVQQYK